MKKSYFLLPFLLLLKPVFSEDLPLTVENLLTEKKEFRFELGLNYANFDRNNVNSQFGLIQTGANNFVLLPVNVSDQRQNGDVFSLTLGARYGITDKAEIYSRLTATYDDIRIQRGDENNSSSSKQLNDFTLGANYLFSDDNDTPAFLGFAEISAVENTSIDQSDFVYGRTAQIGFTTYRSIDPVVLSLTAGYRHAFNRSVNGESVNPGDLLFINPSLSFAINNEVTVTGGVQFKFREKDKVNGDRVGIRTSQTDLSFGVDYQEVLATQYLTMAQEGFHGEGLADLLAMVL